MRPTGSSFVQQREELVEVTFQARDLLGNIATVGEEDDFLGQPFVVHGQFHARAREAFAHGLPVVPRRVGLTRADVGEPSAHVLERVRQIVGEMLALARAHGHEFVQTPAQRRLRPAARVARRSAGSSVRRITPGARRTVSMLTSPRAPSSRCSASIAE